MAGFIHAKSGADATCALAEQKRAAIDVASAGVVELVDAPDSKSGSARSVGSIPTARTKVYLAFL